MVRLAKRMQDVQSPIIPVVGELICDHPGTISLGQGVVHYGPPPQALAHAARFPLDITDHQYKLVAGIGPLLEALQHKLNMGNGINIDTDQAIVVTAGGNMAFMNAIYTITDPGDEVILPVPYYFNHEMAIMMASCKPVLVDTDDNYQLNLVALQQAITPKTRAIVTVSPNNPTGAVYPEAVLRQVNKMCQAHGLYHISDEAYENFTYDDAKHFSPGSITGSGAHTISLFSFSKAYGMASWRVGYMVVHNDLLFSIKKAQDTILICPPVICQQAAVGALEAGSDYCQEQLRDLCQVRALVREQLDALSRFAVLPPADGAFYMMMRLETKLTPMQVVRRLIKEFAVAVIPGTTFGVKQGCTLRLSYGSLDKQTVVDGIGRLVTGLNAIVGGQ